MLADLYHAAAKATAPPPDWPAQELAKWASAALATAVSTNEAAWTELQWTRWPNLYDLNGSLHEAPWDCLGWWFVETQAQRVADKRDVPVWSPGRFEGNRRSDRGTLALYALVLDCDDYGDWTALLTALNGAGLAFLAHRSPSHGLPSKDGARAMVKWRLVLPLARPVVGPDLAHWRDAYTAARLVFGAVGGCWFDHTTHNTSRMWFATAAVGDTPARELVYPIAGHTLGLGNLLHAASRLARVQRPSAGFAPSASRRAGDPTERGRRYLAKMGSAAVGERNATAFRGAAWLVNDLGLAPSEALALLVDWNAANADPLPERELQACLASASRGGTQRSTTAV